MKHGTPFRAAMMMAASLAAMAQSMGAHTLGFQMAARDLAPYEGRGKGKTRRHDNGGTATAKRAATKARNIKRHRAHCKG